MTEMLRLSEHESLEGEVCWTIVGGREQTKIIAPRAKMDYVTGSVQPYQLQRIGWTTFPV
jgi:hypothetical protein